MYAMGAKTTVGQAVEARQWQRSVGASRPTGNMNGVSLQLQPPERAHHGRGVVPASWLSRNFALKVETFNIFTRSLATLLFNVIF